MSSKSDFTPPGLRSPQPQVPEDTVTPEPIAMEPEAREASPPVMLEAPAEKSSFLQSDLDANVTAGNPFIAYASIPSKDLPSRGLIYPVGATIEYRGYTLGELELFEEQQMSEIERFKIVLAGIKCSSNLSVYDLSLGDTLFLALLRRIRSLGAEEMFVSTTCPKCNQISTITHSTSEFEMIDLAVPKLPITLNRAEGGSIQFSPVTIGRYVQLLESGYNPPKSTILLASSCISHPFEDALNIVSETTHPQDIRAMKQIQRMLFHRVTPLKIICGAEIPSEDVTTHKCGYVYTAALDSAEESFIYPFRKPGATPEAEITFG